MHNPYDSTMFTTATLKAYEKKIVNDLKSPEYAAASTQELMKLRLNQVREVLAHRSTLEQFTNKQIRGAVTNLRHAKQNRPGGLLVAEQAALEDLTAELRRREKAATHGH